MQEQFAEIFRQRRWDLHTHMNICMQFRRHVKKDRDLEVSDYEGSVAELKLFKSVGGQTLVEASTLDYGRNLSLLKKNV